MADIFPPPLFVKIEPRRVQQPEYYYNYALYNAPSSANIARGLILYESRARFPYEIFYPIPGMPRPLAALSTTKPFNQTEWPNPILRTYSAPVVETPNLRIIPLPLLNTKPFLQSQWPLPEGFRLITGRRTQREFGPVSFALSTPPISGTQHGFLLTLWCGR